MYFYVPCVADGYSASSVARAAFDDVAADFYAVVQYGVFRVRGVDHYCDPCSAELGPAVTAVDYDVVRNGDIHAVSGFFPP